MSADFDAAGAPMSATVTVDRARYDTLRLGDSIDIRYLTILPLIARTPDRSTATVVGEAARQLLGSQLLWWVGCGVVAMVIAARVGVAPIVVTGLLWMAWGYILLLRMPEVPVPTGVETTARVRGVTLVAKSPARVSRRRRSRSYSSESVRRLAVPYQVIELQVPIRGHPDSVIAVDAVDSGSVAGMAFGAVLRVRHPRPSRCHGRDGDKKLRRSQPLSLPASCPGTPAHRDARRLGLPAATRPRGWLFRQERLGPSGREHPAGDFRPRLERARRSPGTSTRHGAPA